MTGETGGTAGAASWSLTTGLWGKWLDCKMWLYYLQLGSRGKDWTRKAEVCKTPGVWILLVTNEFVFGTLTKKFTFSTYSLGSKRIRFDM